MKILLCKICLLVTIYGLNQDSILSYNEHFELALSHFKKDRFLLAEDEFKKILIDKRNYEDPVSHFFLARAQFEQNKMILCQRTCNSYLNKYPQSPYDSYVRTMLIDINISKENFYSAFDQLLKARISVADSLVIMKLDKRILNCIMIGINSDNLEKLLFLNDNMVNKSILSLAIAYKSLLDGKMNKMELSLSVIDMTLLPSFYNDLYNKISLFIGKNSSQNSNIAIILPLTGLDGAKGKTYLTGLSRMVNDYKFDIATNFKIYDNKSNDIKTLEILNKISLDKSIVSILGFMSEVSNLAATSFSSTIPIMLSKSNHGDLAKHSDEIYLLSTSNEMQAKLSAKYAVNILGFKNIAVLSSANDINKNYANYFIEQLNQLGIDAIVVEWYYGKPENLSKQFLSIREKAWSLVPKEDPNTKYLDLKIDSLDALFDVDVADFMEPFMDKDLDDQMTKKDSLKVILSTIEAIYIPIDKKDLSFIGTQLPMYNLDTKIIGNESWMDIDILSQDIIGPHLQGLTVLSSEYPQFGLTESSELDRIFSMGYDHGYFVNSLTKLSSSSRQKFKNLLKEGDLFMGASSLIELSGPNKNENQIVRVLEYNMNRLRTIGFFNGKSLVENQSSIY